jgi:uncharacterized damage-inducible protein DinB
MQFSNPAGSAKAASTAYVASLLELLGTRDPYEVQEELARWLRSVYSEMSPEDLRRREAPGKWSVLETVAHLADSEIVTSYRYRMTLAHDRPGIEGYDQDRWAARLHYNEVDPDLALDTIRVLRERNLRMLRSLTEEEVAREGLHSERGPESVRRVLTLVAAHDLVHRRQIERIRRAVSSGSTGSAGVTGSAGASDR